MRPAAVCVLCVTPDRPGSWRGLIKGTSNGETLLIWITMIKMDFYMSAVFSSKRFLVFYFKIKGSVACTPVKFTFYIT